jgi:hypothetical protein
MGLDMNSFRGDVGLIEYIENCPGAGGIELRLVGHSDY